MCKFVSKVTKYCIGTLIWAFASGSLKGSEGVSPKWACTGSTFPNWSKVPIW